MKVWRQNNSSLPPVVLHLAAEFLCAENPNKKTTNLQPAILPTQPLYAHYDASFPAIHAMKGQIRQFGFIYSQSALASALEMVAAHCLTAFGPEDQAGRQKVLL